MNWKLVFVGGVHALVDIKLRIIAGKEVSMDFFHQNLAEIDAEKSNLESLLLYWENGFYSDNEFLGEAINQFGTFGLDWAKDQISYYRCKGRKGAAQEP